MITLPCGCAYKIITVDPLGLSVKPGCSEGRFANKQGTAFIARHLGIGYAIDAQAARARLAHFPRRPDVASETFSYTLHDHGDLEYEWDVLAAQRLAEGRQVLMEPVAPLANALQAGVSEVDPVRVMTDPTIDPDLPCLIVPLPFPTLPDGTSQHVLIDGWHRVGRAFVEARAEIPIVILTADDERAIRLRPRDFEIGGDSGPTRSGAAAGVA